MAAESSLIPNQGTGFDLGGFCTFTGTLTCSIFKTLYKTLLRPDLENNPNMVSTGETSLENLWARLPATQSRFLERILSITHPE